MNRPERPAHKSRVVRTNRQLIVFSDDWGRHPSSCQHLVRQLLTDWDVTWVNTIGTRLPRFDRMTMSRGWQKLKEWSHSGGQGQPGQDSQPRILNPAMWPGFSSAWQRRMNRWLLSRHLRRHIPSLSESIVLTTIPVVADLVGTVNAKRWIYYCVDDFSCWPGLDSRPLRMMEEELISKVDAIVAAGENLAARIREMGRQVTVISHGIDVENWSGATRPHPRLSDLPRPRILFWGLIDRRLDTKLLNALGDGMKAGTIVLLGPEQAPDPALDSISRVRRLGPVPFSELPSAAHAADVLIMPYADLPVTRAMQPLKLKEYLATGKPVVARRLPAVHEWEDCLDATDLTEDFVAAVVDRVNTGTPHKQKQARNRLAAESWREKAKLLQQALLGA